MSGTGSIQDRRRKNPAIIALQHDGEVFARWNRFANFSRRARPLPSHGQRSDDVRFKQRAAAIFPAADRRAVLGVKADEEDRRMVRTRTYGDNEGLSVASQMERDMHSS